jgi:Domain of Unknown Function (DUF928)
MTWLNSASQSASINLNRAIFIQYCEINAELIQEELVNMHRSTLSSIIFTRSLRLFSYTFSLWLGVTAIALAEYIPPPYSPPPESPDATGTRGPCNQNEQTLLANSQIAITLLAPQTHIGQTISTHPTFAWFVNDAQSFPLEFHLYEYQANGERQILEINLQSSPGIMTWSLPKDEPGLAIGQRYRWQVVLVCNPNHYSNARVAEAVFDVVEAQPDLETAIASATTFLMKSEIYASRGLWYDALNETWSLTEDRRARVARLDLLADLARLEESAESGSSQNSTRALQLRQIIEFENF